MRKSFIVLAIFLFFVKDVGAQCLDLNEAENLIISASVTVCPGTYNLDVGLEIEADEVTVDGNGAVLLCNAECADAIVIAERHNVALKNFNICDFNTGVSVNNSANVNLTNLVIDSTHFGIIVNNSVEVSVVENYFNQVVENIAVEAGDQVIIEANEIIQPESGAIGLHNSTNFEIVYNTIEDYNNILYTIYDSSSGLIEGNKATSIDNENGEMADVQFSNGIVFFGNIFEFLGDVSYAEELRILNCHDVWVVSNMIKGNSQRPGIKIMSGKGYETYNIYLITNILMDNHWGITLNQEGPQIMNPQGVPETGDLHDVYIFRNLIYGAGNEGLFITYRAHDVKVVGNIIYGNETGVLMNEGATKIWLQKNVILENEVGVVYENVMDNHEILDVVGWNSNSGIQFSSKEIQAGNLLEDIKFIENGRDITYYK